AAETKLRLADSDIAQKTAKLESMQKDLAQLAIVQYQTGSVSMTAQLLAADDEAAFLSSLATLSSVAERTNGRLQDVQVEQAELERLRASAAENAKKMKAAKERQQKLLKQHEAKERRAKEILNNLRTEERNRLLSIQQQRREEAARAVGHTSDNKKKKSNNPVIIGDGSGSSRARQAVSWARTQVGKPYLFAVAGPRGYDCSGLTTAAYRRVGISLPRTARGQFNVGKPVSRKNLRVGDLLFFYRGITHVGLYAGNGVMVHSAPSGHGVHYTKLSSYPSYQGARRVA
ncbi:MAG: hypothetical protein CR979_03650, partial [Propionibacterium sp.]